MTPVAFNTDGAVIAPRTAVGDGGSMTGLYPWTWPELPERVQSWIERMAEGGQISRYRDVPRDLLTALLKADAEQSSPDDDAFKKAGDVVAGIVTHVERSIP